MITSDSGEIRTATLKPNRGSELNHQCIERAEGILPCHARFWTNARRPIRSLERNCLAHLYHTKPGILIIRGGSATKHLTIDTGTLLIHADVLADDTRAACLRSRSHVNADQKSCSSAAPRLLEIRDEAARDADQKLKTILTRANKSTQNTAAVLPRIGFRLQDALSLRFHHREFTGAGPVTDLFDYGVRNC